MYMYVFVPVWFVVTWNKSIHVRWRLVDGACEIAFKLCTVFVLDTCINQNLRPTIDGCGAPLHKREGSKWHEVQDVLIDRKLPAARWVRRGLESIIDMCVIENKNRYQFDQLQVYLSIIHKFMLQNDRCGNSAFYDLTQKRLHIYSIAFHIIYFIYRNARLCQTDARWRA